MELDSTTPNLSHINQKGEAVMVDISQKPDTDRVAVAQGFIRLSPATIQVLKDGAAPKGDVLAAARIAGIMAAKRTSELIPLCHPIPITKATVDLNIEPDGVSISATVSVNGKTGVEMESLTAVSVTALTIYDMVKAIDKSAVIENIRLEHKLGGKSGEYRRNS